MSLPPLPKKIRKKIACTMYITSTRFYKTSFRDFCKVWKFLPDPHRISVKACTDGFQYVTRTMNISINRKKFNKGMPNYQNCTWSSATPSLGYFMEDFNFSLLGGSGQTFRLLVKLSDFDFLAQNIFKKQISIFSSKFSPNLVIINIIKKYKKIVKNKGFFPSKGGLCITN